MTTWLSTLPSTKNIIYTLIALLIAFIGIYGYFLQQTINTVVDRSQTEHEIAELRSEIGDAEQAFGANVGAATIERAKKLGFERVGSARFVTRNTGDSTLVKANVQNE